MIAKMNISKEIYIYIYFEKDILSRIAYDIRAFFINVKKQNRRVEVLAPLCYS